MLKQIIEENDTRSGFLFDIAIQTLIVVSLISFSLETLPNNSTQFAATLHWIEVATVLIFSAEYLTRLYVADSKIGFATSFFGIVDLMAILPFYISSGIDLRTVRAFRMLRMFRILKLARYSKAVQRFHCALVLAKEELVLFFCVTTILLYLATVGIYYFENDAQTEAFASVFHSLWWAVATLTTVGYGDVYPITAGGRIFTFFVLLIGLGIVAVPAGLFSAALLKAREMETESLPLNES